jgi:hypothetical protein
VGCHDHTHAAHAEHTFDPILACQNFPGRNGRFHGDHRIVHQKPSRVDRDLSFASEPGAL